MSDARQTFQEFVEPEFDSASTPPPKPFSVWTPSRILAWTEPPDLDILGSGLLRRSGLMVIAGQGGVGKSRLALQLAISQILGVPFVGLPTRGEPARWLMIGNENSIARLKSDLAAMLSGLAPERLAAIDSNLHLHVPAELDNHFIGLGDEEVKSRWIATITQIRPAVLVADPFGNILIGDLLKDADVRRTIAEITAIARKADPRMAIIILHHARTGRQNISQATGWDRGNFLLGSKALFSAARTVINLAPGDKEDNGVVVMSCGKSNDCRPFPTVGLRLEEATHRYAVDPDFDVEAWEADVSGERSGSQKSLTIQDVVDHIAAAGGRVEKNELKSALCERFGCCRSTVERRLKEGFQHQYLRADSRSIIHLTAKAKASRATTPERDENLF